MPYDDPEVVPAPADFSALLILQGGSPPGPYYGQPGTEDAIDLTLAAGIAREQSHFASTDEIDPGNVAITPHVPPETDTDVEAVEGAGPPPPPEGGPEDAPPPEFDAPPRLQPLPSEPPPPQLPTPRAPPLEGELLPGPRNPVTIWEDYGDIPGDTFGPGRRIIESAADRLLRRIVFGGGPWGQVLSEIIKTSDLGSGSLPLPPILPPSIPAPEPPVFAIPDRPIPNREPDFPAPVAPDVVEVTAPAPKAPPVPRSSQTLPRFSTFPWPVIGAIAATLLHRRPRTPSWPLPTPGAASAEPFTPPTPGTLPAPSTPSQPLPNPQPQPSSSPPLTPSLTQSVESPPGEQCETPQQTKDRRQRKRDNCGKFVTIKVRAHTKRVCLSDAARHEFRKGIRRAKGKLKREFKKAGVTIPNPLAAKRQLRRYVRKYTRLPTQKIPGTDLGIDPNKFLPKGWRLP